LSPGLRDYDLALTWLTRCDVSRALPLGREVVKSADAAAQLADAPSVVQAPRGGGGGRSGEVTYPRCFLLYNTLMFFIFKVRVKRRQGGRSGFGSAPFF